MQFWKQTNLEQQSKKTRLQCGTHYTNKFLKNCLPPSIKSNLFWEEGCAWLPACLSEYMLVNVIPPPCCWCLHQHSYFIHIISPACIFSIHTKPSWMADEKIFDLLFTILFKFNSMVASKYHFYLFWCNLEYCQHQRLEQSLKGIILLWFNNRPVCCLSQFSAMDTLTQT